jgi:hypothetical protein
METWILATAILAPVMMLYLAARIEGRRRREQ